MRLDQVKTVVKKIALPAPPSGITILSGVILLVFVAALTGHTAYGWVGKKRQQEKLAEAVDKPLVTAADISSLFERRFFYQKEVPPVFTKALSFGEVTVATTIQPRVQEHLHNLFQKYAPLIAAGVVLDARSGAVLAMANYTKGSAGRELLPDGEDNYCLYAGFPAASLIKIITAAAALEIKGFSPEQTLPVAGRYHTLYRSQLGLDKPLHRAEQVPLSKAFALSINPFFGVLGTTYLSDAAFTKIAQGFLFNTQIPFDLPVQPSTLMQPHDDFERAERASGYNTQTIISPLHAALIASLAANEGTIMQPYLVERVTDSAGKELYSKSITTLSSPLSSASVQQLRTLMQATVRTGTARGAFAYLRARRETNDWVTGGKTGSIDLPGHRGRCDWFAGFGQDGETRIAVACILIHGANRTVRSSYVASQAVLACLAEKNPGLFGDQHAVRPRKATAKKDSFSPPTEQRVAKKSFKAKKRRPSQHATTPRDTATGG